MLMKMMFCIIFTFRPNYKVGSRFYLKVGSRFYLTARYKYRKKFDFWIRYGVWNYRNEETLLSGLEEIQGNVRSDVKVVFRYLF